MHSVLGCRVQGAWCRVLGVPRPSVRGEGGYLVRWARVIVTVTAIAAAACSETPDSSAGSKPPQPDAKTVASKVNLDEIFPPGDGRDLVLNNCQNCHTFVPIVVLQMEEDAWTRNSIDHRERVTQVSDDDFKTMYTYLKANFHPGRPVPKLPKELLDTWTSY